MKGQSIKAWMVAGEGDLERKSARRLSLEQRLPSGVLGGANLVLPQVLLQRRDDCFLVVYKAGYYPGLWLWQFVP